MYKKKINYTFLIFLLISSLGFSQTQLSGKITKKGAAEILTGVTVKNLGQKTYNVSDLGGNYKISASAGDSLIFSSAGYLPDTLLVNSSILFNTYDVQLVPCIVILPFIFIDEKAKYQSDSIKRREDYRFVYEKKHPVKLMNEKRPGDEPGFNFSPIGYFSTRESQKRRLKKHLYIEEEEYFIDYKFSASHAAQLTKLKGDSFQVFMVRFRPTYKFCRNASSQDILLYINDKLKLFRKG